MTLIRKNEGGNNIYKVGNKEASYRKGLRKWRVETGDKVEDFKTIEDLVKVYSEFKEFRDIENLLKSRAKMGESVSLNPRSSWKHLKAVKTKETREECYYCVGTGSAGFLPCTNCGGKGYIIIKTTLS